MTLEFSWQIFSKNTHYKISWNPSSWSIVVPRGRTVNRDKLIFAFYNCFANVSKNSYIGASSTDWGGAVSAYVVQSVRMWCSQCVCGAVSAYVVQSVRVWCSQCVCGAVSVYVVQSVCMWCSQCVCGAVSAYVVQSVRMWCSQCVCGAVSACVVQSVRMWCSQCVCGAGSYFFILPATFLHTLYEFLHNARQARVSQPCVHETSQHTLWKLYTSNITITTIIVQVWQT
jgi:hypothetical protein